MQEARFEEALEVLERAERARLDGPELVELLSLRSQVRYTLSVDEEALDRDLSGLASLDPDHEFPPEVPPGLRTRFEQRRAALTGPLDLRMEWDADGVRVEVANDPANLVHRVRIHALGEAGWRVIENDHLDLTELRPRGVWLEGLSRAGGVVMRRGSESEPLAVRLPAMANASFAPAPDEEEEVPPVLSPPTLPQDEPTGDDTAVFWVLGGVGVTIGIALAIVIGVVAGSQGGTESGHTTVAPPVVLGY